MKVFKNNREYLIWKIQIILLLLLSITSPILLWFALN